MQETERCAPRTRKRLGAEREQALLDVALGLLCEVGYDRMSVDEVARRAHTSKTTLYRRWPCKADMVAAAFLCRKMNMQRPQPAATLREDLIAQFSQVCQDISANQPLTQGLLTAVGTDPYLANLIKLQSAATLQHDIGAIIERAVERGELPPRATEHTPSVAEVMHALIITRLILSRTPLDPTYIEQVVDTILLPILRAA